jgi:putative ABC transport system permease protein
MEGVWQDLNYGLRGFRKQAGFTALATVSLALGIGAATAIFSVIDNVLLDPWPYRDADRIVSVQVHDLQRSAPGGRGAYPTPEFLEYVRQTHVFEDVVGVGNSDVLYTTREGTERLQAAEVTANAFRFLGMQPLAGRGIEPEDGKPGAPEVFAMSYKMWVKYFSRDPNLIGRSFILNDQRRTLVGIMPPRFTYFGADLWLPRDPDLAAPDAQRRFFFLQARLKRGVTLAQAATDFDVVSRRMAKLYPANYPERFNINVVTLTDMVVGRFRNTLMALLAAVALLLFIACANVANMLLARATAREKEISIRSALGASRWRVARQLLIESFLLAAGGAMLGCILAYAALHVLIGLIPENLIPSESVITINIPVLLFSLAIAILTTLLSGLAPAIHAVRRQLATSLRDSGKGVSGGFRHAKLRNSIVVAEIAFSLVLLAGAGLLMRTMVALQTVDLGLNPDNILVARLPLPKERYKTAAAKQQFFSQALRRIAELPGVIAVTETSTLPPYGGIRTEVEIPGKTHPEKWEAIFQLCSEGYFTTLGIQLLRGRPLSEAEVNDARKVAVVNQTLVKKFFGKEDPIGRRIKLSMLETEVDPPVKDPVFEIIGVVADARNNGIQDPPRPELFVPYTITGAFQRGILVRTSKDPLTMLNAVRREIWALDRNVALTLTGSLNDYLKSFSYAEPRFSLILLSVFASLGLVLVLIGVYSVIAYTVSRQTHEIGIRMALGAGSTDVLRMVLWMGARLLGMGLAVGLVASFAVARLIASQLWGVSPYDPVTLCAVVTIVAVTGLAACYFPARRATRVDPMVALRYQ